MIENMPTWFNVLVLLIGGSGIVWTVWSKFGEAIKSFFVIKREIRSSDIRNKLEEIDVMEKYESFFEKRLDKLLQEISTLENEYADYKKKKSNYIRYLIGVLNKNQIEYKSIDDEQFN